MHPDKSMTRIVDGKRYAVRTATLIASDEYWDGHNFEHGGRNQFLYKTRLGAYFTVTLTQWQGEQNTLEPVTRAEAIELFEGPLTEHPLTWSEAFDAEPEEPAAIGRPTLGDEKMKLASIWLPEELIAWLKSQPGGMGETTRALIKTAMDLDHAPGR